MSDNSGSCQIVRFVPVKCVAQELQDFAEDFFEVVSNDYTDDGLEQISGYLRNSVSVEDMLQAAKYMGLILPEYTVEKISSDDWLADNVIKFDPLEEREFLVYGVHEKEIDTKGKIGVKVYAATAFGSEHQTTRCCLQAISDINVLGNNPKQVLDVGTGSGILSIAAAKLWPASHIIAVDIDEESVIVTAQNAEDNAVSNQIEVSYSDGYTAHIVSRNSPYDVIFANILARPLIAMANDMADNLKIGGYAVISGFIDEQTKWVIDEHRKYGLEVEKIYSMDNWRAALLKRIK